MEDEEVLYILLTMLGYAVVAKVVVEVAVLVGRVLR